MSKLSPDTKKYLSYAKKWVVNIPYSMAGHADCYHKLKAGKKPASGDCSAFVLGVLAHDGYKVHQASTPTMDAEPGLKRIKPDEATVGDVVIVNKGDGYNSNGHTAFLLQPWKKYGKHTKVLQESVYHDLKNVNVKEFGPSFADLAGGKTRFYHPTKP